MHVGADGLDRGALARIRSRGQQGPQALFGAILLQPDHLTAHDIGQHRPELLPFAALNLVGAQMPRPVLGPAPVPRLEKRAFRPTRGAPTHGVPDRRMTCRHRLTIEANPLPEPPGQARMRVRKPDALGANAALSAPHSAQPISQPHRMLGPRQVVPGAHLRITHLTGATPTARAGKPMTPFPLQLENQPAVIAAFHRRHPVIRQTQNPRTIAERSHLPSLVVSTSRKDTIESSMGKWDRVSRFVDVQAAEQTAHPSAVRAGGRVTPLRRYPACIQIGEEPFFRFGYVGRHPSDLPCRFL
jgi:hypothetical protein